MEEPAERVAKPGLPRWLLSIGIAAVVLIGGLGLLVVWNLYFSAHGRHVQVLSRIDARVSPALSAFCTQHGRQDYEWKDPDVCAQGATLRAMQMALFNVFFRSDRNPPVADRVRAIADRLDANDGADLKTKDGCLRLFALFEEASSDFKAYGPTFDVYRLRDEGKILTLQPK